MLLPSLFGDGAAEATMAGVMLLLSLAGIGVAEAMLAMA
jgi:hypothetical protein